MALEKLEYAKLAEQTERYDDMVKYMTEYVESKKEGLSVEERNLLSVAYKNKIGARRAAHRITFNEKGKVEKSADSDKDKKLKALGFLLEKIERETDDVYEKITDLIDNYLVPNLGEFSDQEQSEVTEERVFYYKMKGDYCRYKAEFSFGSVKAEASEKSLQAYKEAQKFAENLGTTHPVRLGLSLNFSVFYYEICDNSEEACKIAKKAFDDAIADLDKVQEEKYKDSTLIMQLLRDNLTLWTSDGKDDEESAQ